MKSLSVPNILNEILKLRAREAINLIFTPQPHTGVTQFQFNHRDMKISLPAITAALLACALACGCNRSPVKTPGRYQISSGTYDLFVHREDGVTKRTEPAIFKIDTITGQTWLYASDGYFETNGLITYSGWSEITNLTRKEITSLTIVSFTFSNGVAIPQYHSHPMTGNFWQ
ncbi:MAG TPA: hypothetical protein VGY98_16390 [Verrucomicrobiae bacterium]|nr:hypothetical protein [Verrucomicrobiae bacterium]